MTYTIQLLTIFLLLITASCGGDKSRETNPASSSASSNSSTTDTTSSSTASSLVTLQSITKVAGDNQIAEAGTIVAVAPQVLIKDHAGNAAVGIQINFAATDDNGAVTNTLVTTDSSGYASWDSWTLHSSGGINTLTVTAADLAPVTFSATGISVSSQVSISRLTPLSGLINDPDVPVTVKVTSVYTLASVSLSFNSNTTSMQYDPATTTWSGNLALGSPPRGDLQYIITATDINGNTTQTANTLTFDRRPVMAIATLPKGLVAKPNMTFNITCSDDDSAGCESVKIFIGSTFRIAIGKDSIAETIDFSSYEGQAVPLLFVSQDSAGQTTLAKKTLYVDSSPKLSVWAELDGTVWDVLGTRILFLDESGTLPALKIYDKSSETTQLLEASAQFVPPVCTAYNGRLTPTGAIYKKCDDNKLYEWRSGSTAALSTDSSDLANIAGNWGLYGSNNSLWLRDLVTGTSTLAANNAPINSPPGQMLAENGAVVYASNASHNIYRIHNGVQQALTNDASGTLYNQLPIVDGVNTVYLKANISVTPNIYQLATHNGTVETIISANSGTSFGAAGGYIGYKNNDSQIWRHTPGLGEEKLTSFGNMFTTEVDAVAPDGSILINYGKRYLATPGESLEEISSTSGRTLIINGSFFILMGQTVFQVAP